MNQESGNNLGVSSSSMSFTRLNQVLFRAMVLSEGLNGVREGNLLSRSLMWLLVRFSSSKAFGLRV